MMSEPRWSRPSSVPFPSVWRRVTGRKPLPDGRIPKFRIQDVSEDLVEAVLDHMSTIFLHDETLCKSSCLWKEPTSLAEIRDIWREMLGQRAGLVALVEGETDADGRPRIAGCNITGVIHKADKDVPRSFQGIAINKVLGVIEYTESKTEVFDRYGVSEYMTALGLSVSPEFRGQGLGYELLAARFDLGSAIGLQLTVTAFTATSSQILAHRIGMEVLVEVPYESYKKDGEIVFPNVSTKSLKLMAKRIGQEKQT